ncbi:MAG: GNAT family N-acetyltransferase [Phycisphaerae bacterium]|nr:GNAT family N-acetyltransferase [Phycisphaerae bacterium]MDD5380969.1 GNAT family N-acetyltransferase [Phycisphaerae bacterium]
MEIRELTIKNYEEVLTLWESSKGVGLDSDTDTKERIEIYLQRNPGLSFAAFEKGKIIGAVLCGHDGRRGYLHHLTIAEAHRNKGIGAALADKVISKLRTIGIRKCNIFVFADNAGGQAFWKRNGWVERTDLKVMTKDIPP